MTSARIVALCIFTVAVLALTACGNAEGKSDEIDLSGGGLCGRFDLREKCQQLTPGPRPTPDARESGFRLHRIWPQVYIQHAPGINSWEYKVNCDQASSHEIPCFLSDLTAVNAEWPDGTLIELEKDFNMNPYSGEVTRRWVKYGPEDGTLPEPGTYTFRYWEGEDLAYEQEVPYDGVAVPYPTDVTWQRAGNDITVQWTPPPGLDDSMHYKAIIWQVDDSPPATVSNVFDWDASSGVMEDVPLVDGGQYSLNVAIFYDTGYSYSEYIIFDW